MIRRGRLRKPDPDPGETVKSKLTAQRRQAEPPDQAQSVPWGRPDLAVLGSLIALHLGFLWRAALLRGFLVHEDLYAFFEPVKSLLHESLRAGRIPLWAPYLFCGYPLAAEGQTAAYYPISWVVSWLLPSWGAVNWMILLHLILAAVGMYLLARELGLSRFGAWLAAFVFSFSGFLFARVQHLSLLSAGSWLPLTLFFVARAWRGRLLPSGALAAAAWGMAALCGHQQTLFFTILVIVFWLLYQLLSSRPRPVLRAGALLALVVGLGAGLAAVQLLLTAGIAAAFPHGEAGDYSYITSYPLLPKHLLGLVAPNWQGSAADATYHAERSYWTYVIYLGLVPLLLALTGAASRRGRAMALLAALALLLALGPATPIYHVLRFVPGFAHFRVPARFVFVFTFAAALLAAYGWERVAQSPRLRGRRLLVAMVLLAAVSIFDLLRFDRTLVPLASPAVTTARSPVAEVVSKDPTWSRVFILPSPSINGDWLPKGGWAVNPDGWAEARAWLTPNVAMSYRLRELLGYIPFVDLQLGLLVNAATDAALREHDLRLLSLLGVRYLAVGQPGAFPGLESVPAGPFTVYRNPDAFPRVFAVGEVTRCDDPEQARAQVCALAKAGRLRRTAVVAGDLGGFRPAGSSHLTTRIAEPRPERVLIEADTDRDTLLVLNEHWDPGWKALLDGKPAPVTKVDTVLMGTPLPQGKHRVEFHYHPRRLGVGQAISAVSLAIWVALLAVPLLRRRSAPA